MGLIGRAKLFAPFRHSRHSLWSDGPSEFLSPSLHPCAMSMSTRTSKIALAIVLLAVATAAMEIALRYTFDEAEGQDGVIEFVRADKDVEGKFGKILDAEISQQIVQGRRARYRVTIDGEKTDGTIFVDADRMSQEKKYDWGEW